MSISNAARPAISLKLLLSLQLLLFLAPLARLAGAQIKQASREGKCVQPYLDSLENNLLCSYLSSEGLFKLKDCQLMNLAASNNFTQCHQLVNQKTCRFQLTIPYSNHTLKSVLPAPGGCLISTRINITLEGAGQRQEALDLMALMENLSEHPIERYTIKSFVLPKIDIKKFKNHLETLEVLNTKAVSVGLRLQKIRFTRLIIANSEFETMGLETLVFDEETDLSELELSNVAFKRRITDEAIWYECNQSKLDGSPSLRRDIKIKLDRTSKFFESSIINFKNCNHSNPSNNSPPIQVSVSGDDVDGLLDEKSFRSTAFHALRIKGSQLSLAEPIDCCIESNQWLFSLQNKLLAGSLLQSDALEITCRDLGDSKVHEYAPGGNRKLAADCDRMNVAPIITITIVTIAMLALFFLVFSVICYFYVLPKKQELLENRSPHRKLSKNKLKKLPSDAVRTLASEQPLQKSTQTEATTNLNQAPLHSVSSTRSTEMRNSNYNYKKLPKSSKTLKSILKSSPQSNPRSPTASERQPSSVRSPLQSKKSNQSNKSVRGLKSTQSTKTIKSIKSNGANKLPGETRDGNNHKQAGARSPQAQSQLPPSAASKSPAIKLKLKNLILASEASSQARTLKDSPQKE